MKESGTAGAGPRRPGTTDTYPVTSGNPCHPRRIRDLGEPDGQDPVIPCVGAIVVDGAGRILLIRRGHEPGAGLWSLPGGRVEPGETDEQAVIREIAEETGLSVRPGRLAGTVQRPSQGGTARRAGGGVFDIRDYWATVTGGALSAGDDADDVRWVDPADLAGLPLTDGLVDALTEWGVLG